MPFTFFVGVNHDGQSILLGCALLENEWKETYIYLPIPDLVRVYGW